MSARATLTLAQVTRLEALIDRVLTYARGASATPAGTMVSMNEVVSAACDLSAPSSSAGLQVELQLDPSDPQVTADPLALQQILLNLLSNARAALTGRPGRIVVSTCKRGGWVETTVEDDGPGIPAAIKGRLFEPFATTKKDGTGLGLSLSRRIAQRAGGRLDLEDSAKGACFRLRLPPAG